MTIPFSISEGAAVFIPDGAELSQALARTTHLGVGAHHDDLEFMAFHGITECHGRKDRWFGGVTCTDGKGSSRNAAYAHFSQEELGEIRRREQEDAARIGGFGIMIQLGYPSARAIDPRSDSLEEDLLRILGATRPETVYTHNPADKHRTHIGVFAALLRALRRIPRAERPSRLIGCEVWRGLDWVADIEKIRMDVSGSEQLAEKINTVFASQIAGGKRYDIAVAGRRAANATFHEPREGDTATQVLLGMDLTPLLLDDSLGVLEFTRGFIRRFEDEVVAALSPYFSN